MVKIALLTTTALVTWLLWMFVSQYLLCPRFQFENPIAFEGPVIYNPYAGITPGAWYKSNFHAHARAWNGITNGHGTPEDVLKAYRDLGYDFYCVSNYQQVDTTGAYSDSFIPAYEHGYNVRKTHQHVLGSHKVTWLDYMLPQTTHNKQQILNSLYEPGSVIILNHPKIREGYVAEDLERLTGYDCMEVLNPAGISTRAWDDALSAGKRVFIVGNDDTHDVIRKVRVGEMCTYVNVPEKKGNLVLEALKSGMSVGVILGKEHTHAPIPFLQEMRVEGDSIWITMSQSPDSAQVSGYKGSKMPFEMAENVLKFQLRKQDHYGRSTFYFSGGTTLFLNPVFFTPESGYTERAATFDWRNTLLYRALGVSVLILWVAFLSGFIIRKRPPRLRWRTAG